jgi:ribonuclease BN (tRNA processing enzyme)
MQLDRRQCIAGAASLMGSSLFAPNALAAAAPPAAAPTRVILLGTKGGPPLSRSGRNNSSTLILINDVPYVVDCGYGVSRQLIAAGVALGRTRYIFITHHHSDHNLEYGPLLYNSWLSPRPPKIDVYGPVGLDDMTRAFMAYQKFDIETRISDEGMTDLRKMVSVHELRAPGPVMQNDDVRVTSCRVRHPPITESYAYRFDARDRSIVISGDTAYEPELAKFASGADVLVHEALYLPAVDGLARRATNAPRLREHILASHTSTEDVGRIAAEAKVKTLVLSHLVPGDDLSVTEEQWLEGVRKHFKGRVVVAKDLTEV